MEERIRERLIVARAIALAVAALGLAFAVPLGAVLLLASRIDLDLDLDFDGYGIPEKGPPSGTDLHGLDASKGRERWHRHFDDEFCVAGVDGGTAIVLEDDGTLLGIDGRTGRERWSLRVGDDAGVPATGEGLVLAIDETNTLHALDVRSGRRRWNREIASRTSETLAISGGTGVVSEHGVAVGLDLATGTERWRAQLAGAPDHAAVAQGGILFVRSGYRAFVALDMTSGATMWSYETPALVSSNLISLFESLTEAPPIVGGPVVGATFLDPQAPGTSETDLPTTSTVFLDALSGEERWRTKSGSLSSFSFDPQANTLYEYGEGEMLIARDPVTGTPQWQVDTAYGRLLATNGSIFTADYDVLAFDGPTGAPRWSSDSVGADAVPVGLTDGVAVVVSTEP